MLLSVTVFCQTKVTQVKDIFYLYNSATTTISSFCDGYNCRNYFLSDGDTICTIYDNGIVLWKATLASGNISDTLSGTGITGLCRITVPTNIGTQRIIQYNDIVLIYSISDYTPVYSSSIVNTNIFPITIKRNSDNITMCILYNNGVIDWVTTPSMSWTGRVGTTRFKRITLP